MTNPEKDFAYEISVVDFSYKKIVIDNIDLKDALFAEFKELTPKPKLHWYFNHFISDKEWADNCYASREPATTSKKAVAANFYLDSYIDKKTNKLIYLNSDIDRRANRLIKVFNQKQIKSRVEQKYYGRFIQDTTTVRLLNHIKEYFEAFQKYVLTNTTKDTYDVYARATCNNIIALADKLQIQGLKQAVLNSFIDEKENNTISIIFIVDHLMEVNSGYDKQVCEDNYKDLKNYADDIFRRELSKASNLTQEIFNNTPTLGIPRFNTSTINRLLEVLTPHIKPEQKSLLTELLETGKTNKPILFCNNGNKLAYAFKELFDGEYIYQCNKSQLEKWISLNFGYISRGKVKKFTADYLEKIISRAYNFSCQNPLPILKDWQ